MDPNTGYFIKFIVWPLFESWHKWIDSSLSKKIMHLLQENRTRWVESLGGDGLDVFPCVSESKEIREARVQISEVLEETICDDAREKSKSYLAVPSDVPTSSRRHSVPASLPAISPRTVIRRESASEQGASILTHETLIVGKSIVDSVITVGPKINPISSCRSVANMSDMTQSRNLLSVKRDQRRKSLPPLWDPNFTPQVHSPQLLPPTPLQEDVPFVPEQSKKTSKKQTANGSSMKQSQESTNNLSQSASQSQQQKEKTLSASRMLTMVHEGIFANEAKKLPSINLKFSSKTLITEDKENLIPLKIDNKLVRLKFVKIPNVDENSNKSLSRLLNQPRFTGRRGSAPLIPIDEFKTSSRTFGEKNYLHTNRRRGSAPTNGLTNFFKEKQNQVPIPLRERCGGEEDKGSNSTDPLGFGENRRSSAPWNAVAREGIQINSNKSVLGAKEIQLETSSVAAALPLHPGNGQGSGFSDLTSDYISTLARFTSNTIDSRRASNGLELLSGLWKIHSFRAGSSFGSDDSAYIGFSSEGDTPVTPGPTRPHGSGFSPTLLPQKYNSFMQNSTIIRRCSLPTDVLIGGEAIQIQPKWTRNGSSS